VTDIGPQVPEEHLDKVVGALDAVAAETGKAVPQIALNWLLQRPSVANIIVGVARLDAASATTPAYPYRHQRGFAERNPPPIS
jgi:aryl-alcohol dehydrogenase-like predicted oxidoreductase